MNKKKPEDYQPHDCRLVAVSAHASQTGLSVPRIYQLFQEDRLVIVTVSGKQFVKLPLSI